MAEGSFCKKKNKDICFQIKQKYNNNLMNYIPIYLNTSKGISINKNKYIQYTVSSKKDIDTIVKYFTNKNNHPLIGYKLKSFIK